MLRYNGLEIVLEFLDGVVLVERDERCTAVIRPTRGEAADQNDSQPLIHCQGHLS